MNAKWNLRCMNATVLFFGTFLIFNSFTGILVSKKLYAKEEVAKTLTEVKNISPKQAKELIEKEKDVFVLDVRTQEEYDKVHIKGAYLIPIQEL